MLSLHDDDDDNDDDGKSEKMIREGLAQISLFITNIGFQFLWIKNVKRKWGSPSLICELQIDS